MDSPPSNPFGGSGNGNDENGDEAHFESFALSPVADAKSSPMPSLQSIHLQEQQQQQQQQQQQSLSTTMRQQQLKFDSLPSPEELSGPMNDTTAASGNSNSGTNWPPPPPNNNYNTAAINNNSQNNQNQSFFGKVVTCGGICSVEALRPYFNVDTADIIVRMKGSLKYVATVDGFRNEVLYSDNAFQLEYRNDTGGEGAASSGGENGSENQPNTTGTPPPPTSSSTGKGPDLYGPVWITLTLVFFVAVTSNMSLYLHHHHKQKKSIIDEGGTAAEEQWDYDINQLLHATWILYSFSMALPSLFYFVLRLNNCNGLGLVDLICLYGYSLVPYLPVTWLCIVPFSWVQWLFLGIATVLSGMLVLRNVARPILESVSAGGGGMGGAVGLQGKSGGLIMCFVGCHFVFFLVM
mmetsp:Transcript_17330/g.36555  ORF Transcript_17330/g.36555 Transcript_17330/m.36555 type:complete len:408 (-) Transcript_17330:116-1339(-)